MKKLFSAIFLLFLLSGIFATGENYIVSPVRFDCNEEISILYETVCFHEEVVEAKICIKTQATKNYKAK